jgi:hypothetical protein
MYSEHTVLQAALACNQDRAEAARFLALLDPSAVAFTFQTLDDNEERKTQRDKTNAQRKKEGKQTLKDPFARVLNGTLDKHWETLVGLNDQGAGVFVTVNETDGKGRERPNIKRVRAVFVDLDGAPLEPTLQAKSAPHVVVESSPSHYHPYWFVTGIALDAFKPMQKALLARFNGDPSVCDLSRVMRLPGFLRRKGEPVLTRVIHTSERAPYTAAELAEIIPAADPTPHDKNPFQEYGDQRDLPPLWKVEAALAVVADDSREKWIAVGHSIKSAYPGDEGLKLFDAWSKTSPEYDEAYTIKTWDSFKPDSIFKPDSFKPDSISIGTLFHYANEASPGWFERAQSQRRAEQVAQNIKIGDDITESILPSIMTLEEMHERLVFISETGGVADRVTGHIHKKEHAADTYAASKHTYTHVQEDGAKKKKKGPALKFWIASKDRVTVQVLTWVPGAPQICRSPEERKIAFNTWSGLSQIAYPEDWQERVRPFLEHVEFLVPIEKERNRFLQWLAHIVQRPEVLPHTCYLMTTPTTGVGRNLLASMIVRALRGYVAAGISLPELLDGGFTGRLSKKLLAIVDEAREGSGDRRHQRAERLKSIVNEEHRHVNPKYGHQSIEKNCCRWLMFSNHQDAIPFDNSDRRVIVIANPTVRKGEAYYKALWPARRRCLYWIGAAVVGDLGH